MPVSVGSDEENAAHMNFFEWQEKNKRGTQLLLVLFALSVFLIVLAMSLVSTALWTLRFGDGSAGFTFSWWSWKISILVCLAVLALVTFGILRMRKVLSGGGSAVALRMGGKRISSDDKDPTAQRLRNTVEEMAIASGIPVPEVFLLSNEYGINAFAAGYRVHDAAIAVTRGAVENLSRDELQAIVAHEFSHILHGDVRLNMRVLAVLHGIMFVGLAGVFLTRGASMGRWSLRRLDPRMMVLGVLLSGIGSVGVFFGRIIKSCISRQREYLADSSAVQYTRNPDAVAGALKKIGGHRWHARVNHPNAMEISHMYFEHAFPGPAGFLFATHPPLERRIQRIDPRFDGQYPSLHQDEVFPGVVSQVVIHQQKQREVPSFAGFPGGGMAFMAAIGMVEAGHLKMAEGFLRSVPEIVAQAVRYPQLASLIPYILLLDSDSSVQARQLEFLKSKLEAQSFVAFSELRHSVGRLGPEAWIPLLELTIPSLRQLEGPAGRHFIENLKWLVSADEKLSLREFVLVKMIKNHLNLYAHPQGRGIAQFYALRPLLEDVAVLLSAVAHYGQSELREIEFAYSSGMQKLSTRSFGLVPKNQCSFGAIESVLDKITLSSPRIRGRVMEAAATVAAADRRLKLEEAELLRAIGDTLDCPIPLPGWEMVGAGKNTPPA